MNLHLEEICRTFILRKYAEQIYICFTHMFYTLCRYFNDVIVIVSFYILTVNSEIHFSLHFIFLLLIFNSDYLCTDSD